MKVELDARHHGVHQLVRETEIPGEFSDYATPKPDEVRHDEYTIDEDKLIAALPEGFLPEYPRRRVLLAVGDEDGATGQSDLTRFRDWAKYFDAYTLTLVQPVKTGARS